MNNQKRKTRPQIININSIEPLFYSYSIEVNKYSGSCNNINSPYAKLKVPDVAKNISVKIFNLISRINETGHIEWYESCKCKGRLDVSVCNNEQRWNNEKCRCEGRCDKGFIWNPSNCEC